MFRQTVLVAVVAALFACQKSVPLAEYQPASSQEQALKRLLLDFQEAVATRNAATLGGLIHPAATLMIGRERTILSKAEYVRILPDRLAENASIWLGTPKMAVDGDEAEIKIYMRRGGGEILMIFKMILDNGRWSILGWEY